MYNLAMCHELGRGVDKNAAEARRLYQQAATHGHAAARRWLEATKGSGRLQLRWVPRQDGRRRSAMLDAVPQLTNEDAEPAPEDTAEVRPARGAVRHAPARLRSVPRLTRWQLTALTERAIRLYHNHMVRAGCGCAWEHRGA